MSRILLVEDNEMNRDALSRRLIRRGYEVTMAVDGEDALRRVPLDGPDLILMDMSLPLLDAGRSPAASRGTTPRGPFPIIALTAHATPSDLRRALDAGCDDYDTKPIDFVRLLGKIEKLLGSG